MGATSRKDFVLLCVRVAFPFPIRRKEVSVSGDLKYKRRCIQSLLVDSSPHPQEVPLQFALCTVLITAEIFIYLGCAAKVKFPSSQLCVDLGLLACPCTQGIAAIVVYCEELKILC